MDYRFRYHVKQFNKVLPPISQRKVFSVKLLITNSGSCIRNLIISIPPTNSSFKDRLPTNPNPGVLDSKEFYRIYNEKKEARWGIVCMQERLSLDPIPPLSCRLILLNFIVITDKIHQLPPIRVIDMKTNEEFVLENTLTISIS